MRNIAKCKLCNTIIESFHSTDYVECQCGEICVKEGAAMKCAAKSFKNLVRIDDNNREIDVVFKEKDIPKLESDEPTKKQLIEMMELLVQNYTEMHSQALRSFCTNSDIAAALMIILSIFKKHEEEIEKTITNIIRKQQDEILKDLLLSSSCSSQILEDADPPKKTRKKKTNPKPEGDPTASCDPLNA